MRTGAAPATVPTMVARGLADGADAVVFEIVLEHDDPPSGRVILVSGTADEPEVDFAGWLGLIAVLDRLVLGTDGAALDAR